MLPGSGVMEATNPNGMTVETPEQMWARFRGTGEVRNAHPLPQSPCLKHKLHGMIIPWMKAFSTRSDLYENCDESGNTDPQAWKGKLPMGWSMEGAPQMEMYNAPIGGDEDPTPRPQKDLQEPPKAAMAKEEPMVVAPDPPAPPELAMDIEALLADVSKQLEG